MQSNDLKSAEYESIKNIARRSSLCRASVYNAIKAGELPQPTPLFGRRVGIPKDAVDAWLSSKVEGA